MMSQSGARIQSLKEGMSESEWMRFRELCETKLSDNQLTALTMFAQEEKVLSVDSVPQISFNSMDEIEAAYLVKRRRVPAWLLPHLDDAFHDLKNTRENTIRDSLLRKLKLMMEIRWGTPPPHFDRAAFIHSLQEELFGMDEVINRLADVFTAQLYSKDGFIPPILLLGAYGIGKSSLMKALARALSCKHHMIAANCLNDPEDLTGTSSLYGNGYCGRILHYTHLSRETRQLLGWDEIDKVCESRSNSHAGTVLDTLCDLFGTGYFQDTFLGFPVDLRQTIHICTANNLQAIPPVLRDRMEIIELHDHSLSGKKTIAKEYIWRRMQSNCTLNLDISPEAIDNVVEAHADCCGVRDIERDLEKLHHFGISEIHSGRALTRIEKAHVDMKLPTRQRKLVDTEPHIGTVTALAVSDFVGRTLELQAEVEDGTAKLQVTGLPQEDMLDSCRLALHLAAKHTGNSEDCSVWIHLDEGGVKKAGPSAGLSIYLALWSAFTKVPLCRTCCSGEIDLRGKVKAIGRLREKLLAAERDGCSLAFIPAACIHEVPPDLHNVTVVPVTHVKEMTNYLLEHPHDAAQRK